MIPRATYRLQLHKDFTLDDAAGITDYLSELGISHVYCSPYLQARAGSRHGYDVVDHRRISTDLGGEEAHGRFLDALARSSLGHVLDVVPNHMTVTERANRWWWEVLRNGPTSQFASFFDIEWDPPGEKLDRKVLVPILGDHYGRVLENGELQPAVEGGEVVIRYFDHVFPVHSTSVEEIRGHDEPLEDVAARLTGDIEAIHSLLERQHYRLAFWKTAGAELNYRRFFAINDLVALRMENPVVFEHVHELVFRLIKQGRLDGLRIDHIDGLREPHSYLQRLRDEAPDAYIVVEKILEPNEALPRSWPIEGTSGYDFLNVLGGLFVDASGEKPLTDFYVSVIGESADVAELSREKKLLLMSTELSTDIERLTEIFVTVCARHRRHRDYTRIELRDALVETIAAFPIYRTYVNASAKDVSADDVRWVEDAIDRARSRRPDIEGELFSFLSNILLLRVEGEPESELAMRFQQVTGPVMAKGIEDTLFYTFNRFAALNEVGGDPAHFGIELDEFHRLMSRAQETWPDSMLATSTHDTKRSEDVRARLALLSEIPERWTEAAERWSALTERHRTGGVPDRNTEYLFFQTLVGAWPIGPARMREYMAKSSKEAKVHTSWITPDPVFDEALASYVDAALSDAAFTEAVEEFVEPLIEPGWITSLAQTLIKLTAPGVPDTYQGQELWDFSLVDPDNRRPVDYGKRREILTRVTDGSARDAWAARGDGSPKLFLTHRALRLRRERPDVFRGSYMPLVASGARSKNVVAFCRNTEVIAVAPRLVLSMAGDWGDTALQLPEGAWTDVLSGALVGGTARLGDLLRDFPVALLAKDGE